MKVLIALAALVLSFPVRAGDGSSDSFIPRPGAENTTIPIELAPLPEVSTPQAKAALAALKKGLRRDFRPMPNGYRADAQAKCIVEVRHLQVAVGQRLVGDPVFRTWCWSNSLWEGDTGLERLNDFESPAQVLEFVMTFAREHFERERQKILRRPTLGRLFIT